MSKLLFPIMYLENKDFDQDLNLNTGSDVVIIMIQANYCNHCTRCKPDYQEFAEYMYKNHKNVTIATIQTDDTDNNMSDITAVINDSPGVPCFLMYKNSRKVSVHEGSRTKEGFYKFYRDNITN